MAKKQRSRTFDEFVDAFTDPPRGHGGSNPISPETIARAVGHALIAQRQGRMLAFDREIDTLQTMAESAVHLVSQELGTITSRAVTALWAAGWQPADLVAVTTKLLTTVHGDVAASAVVREHAREPNRPVHPLWGKQLEQMAPSWAEPHPGGASWLTELSSGRGVDQRTAVEQVIEVISTMYQLPKLPLLMPPPGPGADRVIAQTPADVSGPLDAKVLAKIRGLLAKAESTEFPEEAESLSVKAQELITRHAIDEAMLGVTGASAGHPGPHGIRIHLIAPYADAKSGLVNAVASANRCRAVFDSRLSFITLFGFPADLAVVDLLFTSLLSQATSAMVAAGRVLDRNGTSRTKSFRHSFLIAYAARIGQRLRESAEASVEVAERELGADLLPVLASRDEAVAQRVAEVFPKLISKSTRVGSAAGWEAGRSAADRAHLGTRARVSPARS